jgi:hypothetical protein
MPTTYMLGLGNVLMSDDGLGPAVLRAFEAQYVVGPDVSLVDLGTPGLDLSPWLADAERVGVSMLPRREPFAHVPWWNTAAKVQAGLGIPPGSTLPVPRHTGAKH